MNMVYERTMDAIICVAKAPFALNVCTRELSMAFGEQFGEKGARASEAFTFRDE